MMVCDVKDDLILKESIEEPSTFYKYDYKDRGRLTHFRSCKTQNVLKELKLDDIIKLMVPTFCNSLPCLFLLG